MKTNFYFVLFFGLVCPILCIGQMEIGLSSGLSNAWMRFSTPPSEPTINPSINTIFVQAIVAIPFKRRWGIQVEPGYIQRGSGYIPSIDESDLHCHYIQLPTFITLRKKVINQIGIQGKAGYNVAYGFRGEMPSQESIPSSVEINPWDYGWQVGFSIYYVTKLGKFQLDTAYFHGQAKILTRPDVSHQNFTIGLTYLILR